MVMSVSVAQLPTGPLALENAFGANVMPANWFDRSVNAGLGVGVGLNVVFHGWCSRGWPAQTPGPIRGPRRKRSANGAP